MQIAMTFSNVSCVGAILQQLSALGEVQTCEAFSLLK